MLKRVVVVYMVHAGRQCVLKLSHRRLFPSLWSQKVDLGFLEASDYSVPAEDRLAFERNGHVATRGVLSSEQLKALRPSVVRGDPAK